MYVSHQLKRNINNIINPAPSFIPCNFILPNSATSCNFIILILKKIILGIEAYEKVEISRQIGKVSGIYWMNHFFKRLKEYLLGRENQVGWCGGERRFMDLYWSWPWSSWSGCYCCGSGGKGILWPLISKDFYSRLFINVCFISLQEWQSSENTYNILWHQNMT